MPRYYAVTCTHCGLLQEFDLMLVKEAERLADEHKRTKRCLTYVSCIELPDAKTFENCDHELCKIFRWQDQIALDIVRCAEFTLLSDDYYSIDYSKLRSPRYVQSWSDEAKAPEDVVFRERGRAQHYRTIR